MTLKTILVVWVSCEQNRLQRPPPQRRHLDLSGVCFAFWGYGAGMCEMIWWITCCYTVCWSLDLHNCYTHTSTCTNAHTVLDLEILPHGASVLFSSVLPPQPYCWYGKSSFVLLQLYQLLALQAGSQVLQDLWFDLIFKSWSIEIITDGFWWRCGTISELTKRKGRNLNLTEFYEVF